MIVVYRFALESTATVEEEVDEMPRDFELEQNYPNSFFANGRGTFGAPSTVIGFQLFVNKHVTLQVFDVNGREVATLVNGRLAAGVHRVIFAPRGANAGLYFYKLTAGTFTQTRKALLLRGREKSPTF